MNRNESRIGVGENPTKEQTLQHEIESLKDIISDHLDNDEAVISVAERDVPGARKITLGIDGLGAWDLDDGGSWTDKLDSALKEYALIKRDDALKLYEESWKEYRERGLGNIVPNSPEWAQYEEWNSRRNRASNAYLSQNRISLMSELKTDLEATLVRVHL